jgi:hypothetical protein
MPSLALPLHNSPRNPCHASNKVTPSHHMVKFLEYDDTQIIGTGLVELHMHDILKTLQRVHIKAAANKISI